MGIGFWEWVVIFLVILLLFGAKRLPEVARSLGKAFNEFKKARDEITKAAESDGGAACGGETDKSAQAAVDAPGEKGKS